MSDRNEMVKRLLDGDIDEAEIAADPVLSSLAERIFGLTIEPITPSKPSHGTSLPPLEPEATTGAMPMVEVVPGAAPTLMQLPNLPMIPVENKKSSGGKGLKITAMVSFIVSFMNIFGLFGFLTSLCTADACNGGATRINLLSIYNITNERGWSAPFPEYGIPDLGAVIASCALFFFAMRK
ncbi:MAG TPA: hypothetical protein EYQ73_07300 [Candidatus Poseidoniales archaeon]|nr:hypothetical protein [Candidatus Poseidoniales archaeon]HIL64740.1 hypothetical protein [Candidatus Poseidoniales archaeon]